MKYIFNLKNRGKKIHFLGIGGISMSAIAKQLHQNGFKISGTDANLSGAKSLLDGYDIPIYKSCLNCDFDAVVVSSAIKSDAPELLYARQNNKPIILRAQLLSEILNSYPNSVGVAGTHGKTTVTALLAHIFNAEKLKFTAHIGGVDNKFSNYVNKGNNLFLTEVCEYKRNIKYLSPKVALLLNVDNDHLDSYKNLSDLKGEFKRYLARAKTAVCFDECKFNNLKNAVYFSVKNASANYFIEHKNSNCKNGEYIVYEHRAPLFKINPPCFYAPHDIVNIIASVAVCRVLKIGVKSIISGINSFNGVKRRNETLYADSKKSVVADYAHHPKQIENAVKNYTKKFGDCVFIFQPHTFSRTQNLFNDFVTALNPCKNLYIYKTYKARESYNLLGDAKTLSNALKNSVYLGDISQLESVFNGLIAGDKHIIILGAGDIYDNVCKFLSDLKGK